MRIAVAACAAILSTLAAADAAGLRLNLTPSMPVGLWRVAASHVPLRRGEVVSVCPPDAEATRVGVERGYIPVGPCPGGDEPLVKPVAAIPGDVVAIFPAGAAVNGHPIQGTAQLARDSAGRSLAPVPTGTYPVGTGEVWLLSGHDPRSFDSRYFGPVPADNVQGVARPVWVRP